MHKKPVAKEPSLAMANQKLVHDLKNDLAILFAAHELLSDVVTTDAQKNHVNLLETGIRKMKQRLDAANRALDQEQAS